MKRDKTNKRFRCSCEFSGHTPNPAERFYTDIEVNAEYQLFDWSRRYGPAIKMLEIHDRTEKKKRIFNSKCEALFTIPCD